jgi:predicted MFS family arabinose efflux permease
MTGHITTEKTMRITANSAITSAPSQSASGIRQFGPLTWIALGTFATGTESFMIAALLPGLASDLSVTLTAAGQLVTVFSLTYAVSSPALSALTAGVGRRNLLLISMTAFALANFLASTATDFWQLFAARILLAAAAGLYVPSASALAGTIVAPERRGTALAIVNGGTSIAVALGVPIGAMVGQTLGWRMTFVGVGIMAAIAVAGLLFGIPRGIDRGLSAPSIRERLAVIRQVPLLVGFVVTMIWATGAYTVYTYFTPYLTTVIRLDAAHVGIAFFVWGVSAAIGLFLGGTLSDRFGPRAVMIPSFAFLACLCRAVRDRRLAVRQKRGRPRHRSDSDLGTGSVGLLSSTAIAADAARRIEDRADCAFAQCFVHVPGFLARRDARVARSHKCACHDTRPDWRGL